MRNIILALVFIMTISFGYEPSKEDIKLASEGDPDEQTYIASLYYKKKDYEKAFFWYEKAAMQEDDMAQYFLAVMYDKGKYVKKDYQKAIFWYEKAANNGDSASQIILTIL